MVSKSPIVCTQLVKLDEGQGFEALPDGMSLLRRHGAAKNVGWHQRYYQNDGNYLQVIRASTM